MRPLHESRLRRDAGNSVVPESQDPGLDFECLKVLTVGV
jgi:hypothetical protein